MKSDFMWHLHSVRKTEGWAQFSQMRPIAMAPAVAPRMPMYPPGGTGLGQHIFYGQAQPTFIPPQQGQQVQHPGGRRATGPGQQNQQPITLMQQQNVPDGSMSGIGGGGMVSVPYDMGGMALRDTGITQPIPIGALASALANASPTKQRTVYAAVVKHMETVAGTEVTSIKEEAVSMIRHPMDGDILLVSDIII
ncbi:unnamed protein product [Lactuca saligna]|uniref:Uncharacterized protein n=1 Tax=Lactuca saligna TaxID=75948 RepID=A0AA35URS2_LACSI|nr:unnamed protein product [Lactuca saligna]